MFDVPLKSARGRKGKIICHLLAADGHLSSMIREGEMALPPARGSQPPGLSTTHYKNVEFL
jgi:hypothetical protein